MKQLKKQTNKQKQKQNKKTKQDKTKTKQNKTKQKHISFWKNVKSFLHHVVIYELYWKNKTLYSC